MLKIRPKIGASGFFTRVLIRKTNNKNGANICLVGNSRISGGLLILGWDVILIQLIS